MIIWAELRQILDRFWIDIGTDEELDDGPDRLPPVTAFTVTMRARKCGNPVSWNRKSLDGYFNGFLSTMSAAGPVSGGYTALRRSPRRGRGTLGDILRGLERVVASRPRTEILTATDDYLHAVCRTRLGLRDDLEFHFFPSEGVAGRLVLGYGLTVAQGGTLRVLDRPGSVQSRICGTDKTTAPAVCPAVIRGRDRHVTRILHG